MTLRAKYVLDHRSMPCSRDEVFDFTTRADRSIRLYVRHAPAQGPAMATPGRHQHPQSDDEDALQTEDQDIRVCMFKPGNDAPLADLRGCLKRLLGAAVIDHIALVVPDLLRHGGHDELSLESPESKLTALGPHASSSEITIETNDHARSLKHDDHLVVRGVGESRPRPSYLELRQRLSNAEAVSVLHHHHYGCNPARCVTLRQPLRRPHAPTRILSFPPPPP